MNKATAKPPAAEPPNASAATSTGMAGLSSAPAPVTRPKLVFPLGRGGRGKTWWLRWAIERAQTAGRNVVVADADRTNATLSGYFGDVVIPPSADDEDMRDWFAEFCEQLFERRFSATLDLGGGDLLLKRLGREVDLVGFLNDRGVQPVAVHVLGPDRDDLAYLNDLEHGQLFAPAATIIVLNEALVPKGRSLASAFDTVRNNDILHKVLDRGAKLVWMPALRPAYQVDERRLTFAAAEANRVKAEQTPLNSFDCQAIATWRRRMEENFGPVAAWLP